MLNKKLIALLFLSLALLNSFCTMGQDAAQVPQTQASSGLNPALMLLIGIAVIFLLCIGILGYVLINVSALNSGKDKNDPCRVSPVSKIPLLLITMLGSSLLANAQADPSAETAIVAQKATSIIGLTPTAFYLLVFTLFIEVVVIFVLMWNIWNLLKKSGPVTDIVPIEEKKEARKLTLNWWEKFNSLKPMAQEENLDTGHEYDGIRELNNRLPPWWLYGFYISILFAVIYLWRFHVSHSAPLAKEEYELSVSNAEEKTKAYLASKGEAIDENTVTLLTGKTDIDAGKVIFEKSCAACHMADGGGMVGPNLTDNFWLHGGDIKSVFKTIKYGINAMPPWQTSYSNKEIAQVASFVASLHGTKPKTPKAPEGVEVMGASSQKPATDSATKTK